MSKAIVVKNEFASKTSEEKEIKIADVIARLINKSSYAENVSAASK